MTLSIGSIAPDFTADAVEVDFDPLSWSPIITQVRLINPVIRARMDAAGRITLPNLQLWLDSLSTNRNTKSPYISDDLAISLSHLRAMLATPGAEHADAETLPRPRAVQGVVPAAVGLPSVLRATATRAAGPDQNQDAPKPAPSWSGFFVR